MKPDQERVKTLISQTVMLLCKNGLHFEKELRIQGLLGVTIDYDSVFIVHINESLTDFAVDTAAAAFSAGNCNDTAETANSKTPSGSCLESDSEKAASSDETLRPHVTTRMSNSQELSVNKRESLLSADVTAVKAEPDFENDDDVVVVESDTEHDTENMSRTCFSASNVLMMKRSCKNRFNSEMLHPRNKRRRLALPAPARRAPAYDDDGGNHAVKMEPVSSQYVGTDGQNLGYEDSFSEQKWENSESIFGNSGVAGNIPGCSSWEGSDHQPREMMLANSIPRANETYQESASGPATLPLNSLDSVTIRDALVNHLVFPHVFHARRRVEAFRIIWRKSGPVELAEAWSQIHDWRRDCDAIMSSVGKFECLFFFSSVSGLYNKSKSRTLAAFCDIYPAISYYVVLASECSLGFHDFAAPMKLRFGDSETKQILSHADGGDGLDLRLLSAPLFTVLKDCSSSYVRNRMRRAVSTTFPFSDAAVNPAAAVAKLVVTNPNLTSAISHSYECIMRACPSLSLQIV